ncbi:MAG: TSUP family transporter [Chloroflexi bacterium]|nr:TSUP family transporter [Chloroflexota bacterium]
MSIDASSAPFLVLLGMLVAAYGNLIGAGGGFLLVPALLLLEPTESPRVITTISLAVVFLSGLSGSVAYSRLRRIDVRSGVILATAAVPGAVVGAWATRLLPRGWFDLGFGFLILALTAYLLLPRRLPAAPLAPSSGSVYRTLTDALGRTYAYAFLWWRALAVGLAGGIISSLAGIGAGPIMVPAIVLFLHFPVHIATATSTFVLTIASGTGTVTHAVAGDFDFGAERIMFLAVGAIVGAQLGARLSSRVSHTVIIRLLAIGVGIVGLSLIRSGVLILSA